MNLIHIQYNCRVYVHLNSEKYYVSQSALVGLIQQVQVDVPNHVKDTQN